MLVKESRAAFQRPDVRDAVAQGRLRSRRRHTGRALPRASRRKSRRCGSWWRRPAFRFSEGRERHDRHATIAAARLLARSRRCRCFRRRRRNGRRGRSASSSAPRPAAVPTSSAACSAKSSASGSARPSRSRTTPRAPAQSRSRWSAARRPTAPPRLMMTAGYPPQMALRNLGFHPLDGYSFVTLVCGYPMVYAVAPRLADQVVRRSAGESQGKPGQADLFDHRAGLDLSCADQVDRA